MSNKPDINWRSFVGPQDNGRVIGPHDWENPPDPQNYDDIFKCSDVHGLTAEGLTIPAGREDSFDAVRGAGYVVSNCDLEGNVTVKGAINGARFENCTIGGKLELGQYDNYWKPGRGPTRDVRLINCQGKGGKPVRVVCWDAKKPMLINTKARVIKVPWIIWWPYFMFRRLTNPRAVK